MGRTFVRALLALAMVLTTLAFTPVGAATPDGLPDPAPSGPECEWMGSVEWERTVSSSSTLYQTSQENFDRYAFVSVPAESGCISTWSAESRRDSSDVDACSTGTGESTRRLTRDADASGTGSGTFSVRISSLDEETYYPVIGGYSDGPFSGTEIITYDNGCGNDDYVTEEPYGNQFSVAAGWCSGDGYSGTWLVPSPDAQVISGSCTFSFSSSDPDTGSSTTSTDTWTWSFRRSVCDPAVDTDGGGVGDCEEWELGTDVEDPDDDGEDKRDRDGDGFLDVDDSCPDDPGVAPDGCPDVDTDGDGFLDSVDDCVSVPGHATAGGCPDADGDGVSDLGDDNCLGTPNSSQADLDADGAGDACDPDADGDDYADVNEEAASLDPRDPDTDDDTLLDGHDNCPSVAGPLENGGCPLLLQLDVEATYAFAGSAAGWTGGLAVDLAGSALSAIPIERVCFRLDWVLVAKGRFTDQLVWNDTVPSAALEETTAPDNDTSTVTRFSKGNATGDRVRMDYCTAPLATSLGLRATYPWQLKVGGIEAGRIQDVAIDNVVMTVYGDGGRALSTIALDDNKAKGKALLISWYERETETVEF